MDYKQTVEWLYSRLPMYQRSGSPAYKKDLTNTIKLCALVDDPHLKIPVIHVAGTNGKGSVSHMIASVLQESGLKTGLYTSPHLLDFRERIKINGHLIPETDVTAFCNQLKEDVEIIQPSFFELTAVMAFHHFCKNNVDIAVIETGLGGRLDSTNVVNPLVSVITNISLEHQNFLGDTLTEIAGEKAGIIKPGIPAVIGREHPETKPVFLKKASEVDATVIFAEHSFTALPLPGTEKLTFDIFKSGDLICKNLSPGIGGDCQNENIVTVLATLNKLEEQYPGFMFDKDKFASGIEKVVDNTGLSGRWQVLMKKPLLICDIAHNPDGLKMVFEQVRKMQFKTLRIVYGTVKDKDLEAVFRELPRKAEYYLCEPSVERALPMDSLSKNCKKYNFHYQVATDAPMACMKAIKESSEDDLILVTGSAFVVADVLKSFKQIPVEPELANDKRTHAKNT